MSGPNSLVDYYEVLEISPNAHIDTISRVYRLLAQRYHPDNTETGDPGRFSQILQAFKVLSDPEARARFDIQLKKKSQTQWQMFDAKQAATGTQSEKEIRFGVLGLLCTKRRRDPHNPWLGLHDMETMLGIPREHLEFSFWFLRERGMINRGDDGSCTITADGVEYLEQNGIQDRARDIATLPRGAGARR